MWRRRGSIGGGTSASPATTKGTKGTESPGLSFLNYPMTPGGVTRSRSDSSSSATTSNNSIYASADRLEPARPLVFTIEVPTPGPLGLDLRARHIERDKPQRGCIVKGFRPLDGGRRGYVEETGRVKVGDILQVIHQTPVDELPFEQIVNHALLLQKEPSAWPLKLEFKRDAEKERESLTGRPRRSSFFRSSIINPAQDGNFNEKLQYFRGFFANRMPTGGTAPKNQKPPPMPSADTVHEMYRDLLLKRGVPDDVLDELMRIEPLETKWHVVWYAQQHANEEHTQSNSAEAAKVAESLVELKWDNKGLKELESLRTKIAVGSAEWLEAFLTHFGLDYLTMKLPDPSPFPVEHHKFEKATRVCEVILRILRSLTHFTAGVEAITSVPGLVKRIALCFHTENGDLKKYTLQLLGIVCYNSAAGHEAVIHAFDQYKNTKGESVRFSCLRDALRSARYSLVFKEDVLSFVNIMVNKAIRLEDRLAIRADFIALDMAGYFEEIRAKSLAVQRKRYPLTTDASPQPMPTPTHTVPSPVVRSETVPGTGRQSLVGTTPRKHSIGTGKSPVLRPLARSFQTSKSAPSSPVDRSDSMTPSPTYTTNRTSLPLERGDHGAVGAKASMGGGTIISSTVTQLRNQLDNVEKQIDVFERFMEEDRKDTIYERTELSSLASVFETLTRNVAHDPELHACLLSILQQLLFIPADRVIGKEMWALCERLMKQVGLLAPVEEVKNFELGYEDRKALLKMRDRYTGFLQKCAEEDPTFEYQMGPVILIQNRDSADDLSDMTADETDDEDAAPEQYVARDHPELVKYFKLLKMGMPLPHVQLKMQTDGVAAFDVSILETPDKVVVVSKPLGDDDSKLRRGTRAAEHEKFAKFFKLLKMGMPLPHVQLKMTAEGLDGAILETPDQLLDDAGDAVKDAVVGVPVKEHAKFAKFFKLLKMGMPAEHIKLKVSAEGLDPALLDAPDQLLNDDGTVFVAPTEELKGIPVKDHAKFAKFFKLMKMGMPAEQIKLKASAEGLDGSLLDTPEKLLDADGKEIKDEVTGVPVKEHVKFAKFFKLLKMGMPLEQIKLKASAEGLDGSLLDTPDALLNEDGTPLTSGSSAPKGVPVKEHAKFVKFFKLLKMGMPAEQIKLKVSAEGLDPALLDSPDKLLNEDGTEIRGEVKGIPVKDHEKFAKFFKLLKMRMPAEQVKLKASAEGLDGALLDTPDALVDADGKAIRADAKLVKASAHPSYAKYFKLLKMGMPRAQVELKMTAEGLDTKLIDTPDAMISDGAPSSAASSGPAKPALPPPPPKPKLRNLYWDIMKAEVTSGTIWEKFAQDANDDDKPAASGLSDLFKKDASSSSSNEPRDDVLAQYVTKLADIFVNQPAKAKESESAKKPTTKKRAPTRVALIDVKRANNIGIMLARFRLPYFKIRDAVLLVDKELLSLEKVTSLLQFAPEPEEIEAVKSYSGDPKLLGDAEQYFREMLCVPRLPSRLQAIHATWQFDTYVEEQQKLMEAVSHACEELEACEPLKQIFRVVLELGNALNDGTARGGAKGFRLNILLKLNQVKASDNSITLLNYVAQLLRAKDPRILEFDKQLPSLESASRVTVQVLRAGESAVRKAATQIVDELAAHAKLPPAEFPSPPHLDGEEPVIITDRFQDVVKPFADRAQKMSDDVVEQLEKTMQSFEDTASFYGEDPASPECGPDSFFSIFYSFAKLLQSADRDNERKRVTEERRVRREEEAKKRLEMLKKKKQQASSFATLKTGDVDDIVEKIRAKRVAEKRAGLLEKALEGSSAGSDAGSGSLGPSAAPLSRSNGPSSSNSNTTSASGAGGSRSHGPHRQLSAEKAVEVA